MCLLAAHGALAVSLMPSLLILHHHRISSEHLRVPGWLAGAQLVCPRRLHKSGSLRVSSHDVACMLDCRVSALQGGALAPHVDNPAGAAAASQAHRPRTTRVLPI